MKIAFYTQAIALLTKQGCELDGFLFEFKFTKILQVWVQVFYFEFKFFYFQFFDFKFEFGKKDRVYRIRIRSPD